VVKKIFFLTAGEGFCEQRALGCQHPRARLLQCAAPPRRGTMTPPSHYSSTTPRRHDLKTAQLLESPHSAARHPHQAQIRGRRYAPHTHFRASVSSANLCAFVDCSLQVKRTRSSLLTLLHLLCSVTMADSDLGLVGPDLDSSAFLLLKINF
jgi:hypothetical protein